jgi:tetratricopeptide (TPR) repeat protein
VPLGSLLVVVLVATACGERSPDAPASTVSPPRERSFAAMPAASLVALAESTYFRAEYDSARAMLQEAISRAPDDSAIQARALTWIGLAAFRQGDYASAHAIGERALALKLRRRFTGELFRSYNALGLLAWQEGRFHDAIGLFERAADAARSTHDSAARATALGNLGSIYMDLGAFREAKEGLLEMQRVAHARGNARTEANATNNLGQLAIRTGDPAVRAEVREVVADLNAATDGIRDYIRALAQPTATPEVLAAGLGELTRRFSDETGRPVRFAVEGLASSGPLPEEAGQHLEQILREALSNTARHAGACSVRVNLVFHPDELDLVVSDDGCGPSRTAVTSDAPGRHEGLRNMRERARRLGGRLEVAANPAGGTRVVLAVPLDSDEPELFVPDTRDQEPEVTLP